MTSNYRELIVGVNNRIPLQSGKYIIPINIDNAASTPPFIKVVEDVVNFTPWYSSVHRGAGYKSVYSTKVFDESRDIIKKFLNAGENHDVIYTQNTTEAINLLAYSLSGNPDDVVISTFMEHNSNDLPWRGKFKLEYANIDSKGKLLLDDLEKKLKKNAGKVKLVTVTGASNVTGYRNPIHEIALMAHKYGAMIHVDGSQLVPHCKVNMQSESIDSSIDFLSFSAHKMYAPFGIGALIGQKDMLRKCNCPYKGGGQVNLVTPQRVYWSDSPEKFEPGTQNLIGVVALTSAINILDKLGMENIEEYENRLNQYLVSKVKDIPNILYYSDIKPDGRVGILSFNINGLKDETVAKILSCENGIAVRNGLFCAHLYCEKLLNVTDDQIKKIINKKCNDVPGMVRASIGLYNDYDEINRFSDVLNHLSENTDYYKKKCEPD
jgi:selenocysteine lyase/cysteine desulfurase